MAQKHIGGAGGRKSGGESDVVGLAAVGTAGLVEQELSHVLRTGQESVATFGRCVDVGSGPVALL